MSLKERVAGPVRFVKMVNSELWYICQDNFEFAIPMEDTAGAEFKAEDKGMFFMRWIRKHMEMLEAARTELFSLRDSDVSTEELAAKCKHLSEGAID